MRLLTTMIMTAMIALGVAGCDKGEKKEAAKDHPDHPAKDHPDHPTKK